MTTNEQPAIEINDLHFQFGRLPVLEGVNLRVETRDFVGLIGPNGCGKTTLVKIILGLLRPAAGSVSIYGQPPVQGRRRIGYVPQHVQLDRDFPITVREVVLMGRLRHRPRGIRYSAEDQQAAEKAMAEMEVLDLARRSIGELSGGQFQRVMIARALASQPDILILDEPTANVDTRLQQEIHDRLKKLNERMTIILISHDVGFISHYVNKVACLNKTLVCHPTAHITPSVIEELYQGHVHLIRHDHHL